MFSFQCMQRLFQPRTDRRDVDLVYHASAPLCAFGLRIMKSAVATIGQDILSLRLACLVQHPSIKDGSLTVDLLDVKGVSSTSMPTPRTISRNHARDQRKSARTTRASTDAPLS